MGRLIDFDSHPNNKNIKIFRQNKMGSLFTVLRNICNKVISQTQQSNPKNTPIVLCNQLVAANSWVEGGGRTGGFLHFNKHPQRRSLYIHFGCIQIQTIAMAER